MQNPDAKSQKSPLDFIAEAYWDDFVQGRPIDGGVLLEEPLRQCELDGSLGSLQRVDAFLEQVQEQNTMRPDLFMQDARCCNLVLFIGFYMGRVLTEAWQTQGEWLGQATLISRYPQLAIHPNNPFHFMALDYFSMGSTEVDSLQVATINTKPKSQPSQVSERLFFVLEPIALKIFAKKIKMPPVIGATIAPSVFAAVLEKLPEDKRAAALENPSLNRIPEPLKQPNQTKKVALNPSVDATSEITLSPKMSALAVVEPIIEVVPTEPLLQQTLQQIVAAQPSLALVNETNRDDSEANIDRTNLLISESTSSLDSSTAVQDKSILPQPSKSILAIQTSDTTNLDATTQPISGPKPDVIDAATTSPVLSSQARVPKRPDAFKELRHELETLTIEQDTENAELAAMYERAVKVLNQVDKVLAADARQDSQISQGNEKTLAGEQSPLPDEAEKISKQAMVVIKKAASQGYTAAMLRLSIYYFLGKGMAQDEQQGFEWVQKAAKAGDIRGMRQMSRLYYQGLGCEQSMELGRYWLEQAAENGHTGATQLLDSWSTAQTIMDEQKFEATIDQRYLILIVVIVLIAVFIIILI